MSRSMRTVTQHWIPNTQGVFVDDPEAVLEAVLDHNEDGFAFRWRIVFIQSDEGYELWVKDDAELRKKIGARLRSVAEATDSEIEAMVDDEVPESVRDFLFALAPMVELLGPEDVILID